MLITFAKKQIKNSALLLCLPLFLFTGCSSETLQGSASLNPTQLSHKLQANVLMAKPIETYTFTARMVQKCWLNTVKPLIPNHVFFASATRKGGEKAHIGIHQRARLGRKGPASFAIMFTTDGMGTSISTMNYKFDTVLSERLKDDVNRWTTGDATCPPPVELIAASTNEIVPAPNSKKKSKKVSKKAKKKRRKKTKNKKSKKKAQSNK